MEEMLMDVVIRNETSADYRAVEELTREAFWNLYVPGCNEHYLAHILRGHADFLPELDLVAEFRGKIVGNIMYTRSWLTDEQGRDLDIVTFGPVSVLPEFQRKGIGSALIARSLQIATEKHMNAVVIFGSPNNYCKHGFKSARDLNISNSEGKCPYAMLALELSKGVLAGHPWIYRDSEAYKFDEQKAEEFDAGFPQKEKGYCYTQEIFSISIRSTVN